MPGHRDQVGDPLDALAQDVVDHLERVGERRLLLDHLQQPVVLDHDQRVDLVRELADPLLGLAAAAAPLEAERPRDDADGQRLELARELGDDRRGAGARAAALAGGDEDHVGALQRLLQLVAALHAGGVADGRVGAGAQPARRLGADVDLHVGVAHQQRLRVGVDGDEFDAREARVDHAVDGIRAAAADADDLDHREIVSGTISHRLCSTSSLTSSCSAGWDLSSPSTVGRVRRIPSRVNAKTLDLDLHNPQAPTFDLRVRSAEPRTGRSGTLTST